MKKPDCADAQSGFSSGDYGRIGNQLPCFAFLDFPRRIA